VNDKELALRAIDCGVGRYLLKDQKHSMLPGPEQHFEINGETMTEADFVRDWRVVGVLMEKCQKVYVEYIGEPEQTVYARSENNRTWDWLAGESLPRTIIEACVEALS